MGANTNQKAEILSGKLEINEIDINVDLKNKHFKIIKIKNEKISCSNIKNKKEEKEVVDHKPKKDKINFKRKKHKKGFVKRFLAFERIKFKNIYNRKFYILARMLKKIYNKKLNELQEKILFVNQCKAFFEEATEATLNHKKEFMSRLEQYEIDSMKLVEFFRMFERNKSEIENIAKNISKVEFKTILDWNRKFKSKFDKIIKL